MKKKASSLLVSVAILAALGGAVWYTMENPPPEDSDAIQLVDVKEDEIVEVTVRQPGSDALTVVRGEDGEWRFGGGLDLRADDAAVGFMATNLSGLEAERVVQEETTDWAPYGLDGDGEVSVDVRFAEGKGAEKKFVFGKSTPTGSSVYVRIEGDPRLMTTYSYVPASFQKTVFDWRDKSLVVVDQDDLRRVSVRISGGAPTTIERDDAAAAWRIVEPRPMRADNFTASDLARSVANAEMTRVVEEGEPASDYGFSKPYAVATAVDAAGAEHTLTIARQSEGVYYARTSDMAGVYELSASAAEGLDVELAALRNKKLFDFGFDELSRIEARDGETSITLERADGKWKLASDGGREVGSEQVQTLIDRMRNLVAIGFPEGAAGGYGLGSPAIEVAATESAEGSEPERVQLSSLDADRVYAVRAGEPTVYELEKAPAEQLREAIEAVAAPPSEEKPAEEQ